MRDMFSSRRRDHTKALIRFCIDTMYDVGLYDYPSGPSSEEAADFQLCTGATYILIKVIGYIMKDQKIEEEYLWREASEMANGVVGPLAIKLAEASLHLLFKPGYTIRYPSSLATLS